MQGKEIRKTVVDYVLIVAGSALYGAATSLLVYPHKLTLGGTSGISVILSNLLPYSPGTIIQVINYLLILLAFVFLGKKMGVRNFAGSVLTTLSIYLFENLFKERTEYPVFENIFVSAIAAGVMIAAASAVMFCVKASSGGTDIVALIINKYARINVGRALLITDIAIVAVGAFFNGFTNGSASLIGLVIKTTLIDVFLFLILRFEKKKKRQ